MRTFCTALAANLTDHYWSAASYHATTSSSLVDYLTETGVLVSMCFGDNDKENPCYLQLPQISGSWIQQATLGPRVFGSFGGVGVVLDPTAVHINCLYPLDAVTQGRQNGTKPDRCGALDFDDGEPMSWLNKQLVKAELSWIKFRHYRHMKWQDIPCSDLFSILEGGDVVDDDHGPMHSPPVLLDHNGTWTVGDFISKRVIERLVGHTICYDDVEPTFDDDTAMLIYGGNDPWMPQEWAANVAATQAAIAKAPTSRGIWNEIVMISQRSNPADLVQAVFYYKVSNRGMNRDARRQAKNLAKVLGKKPVLVFDPSNKRHLFRCARRIKTIDPAFNDSNLFDVVTN